MVDLSPNHQAAVRRLPARSAPPGPEPAVSHFDPARLTLARERAGWTRRDLGTRLGLPTAEILAYERGKKRPHTDDVIRFATELGMPTRYFTRRKPVIVVREEAAHFRKVRSTRQYERRQALATASHLADIVRWTGSSIKLPDLDLPRLDSDAWTPERRPVLGAKLIREAWGIGDRPFWHLIRHMEVHGIVVSMARFGASDRIDAFTCEPPDLGRPLVCLSLDKEDPLRRRFNAAHELGHLVLHGDVRPDDPQQEHEADRFAIELLMPADAIRDDLPWRRDFWTAYAAQEVWGVSLMHIHQRAVELGVMKQKEFEACVRIWKKSKIRREEPIGGDYSAEWPMMLSNALDFGASRGFSPETAAVNLGLPYNEVLELLSLGSEERPTLRLVKSPYGSVGTA